MNDLYWNGTSKSEKSSSDDDKNTVEVSGNHIYFYNGVDIDTALTLNKTLQEQSVKILNSAKTLGIDKPVLHLHINSGGGLVAAGTAIMDTILRLKKEINIYTYVEGRCASAATYVSLVGTKRFITPNSFMLIHQVSSAMWGTYAEFEDKKKNLDSIMKMMKRIYHEHTNVSDEEIDEILKHDIFWDAEESIAHGLVDEII